jgi:multiple sugar transport system substrate-binding protein
VGVGCCAAGLGIGASTRAAPAAIDKKVTLRYWTILDPKGIGPRERAQTQIIQAFHKKYPNIEVVPEIMPIGMMDRQLIQATQAGQGPDVALVNVRRLAQHIPAQSIIPLDAFVKGWSSKEREDFVASWDSTVIGGSKMSLFKSLTVPCLWYRADWLKEKGLPVPKTWDQLIAAAKALTTSTVSGYYLPLSKAVQATGFMDQILPCVWGLGGDLLDQKGRARFQEKPVVQYFQYLYDLVKVHKVTPLGVSTLSADTQLDAFKAGATAMGIEDIVRYSSAREVLGDKLWTTPVISLDPAKPSPASVTGQSFVISKDSKNPEAAWKFIEHNISPEMETILAKVGGEVPTRRSTYDDPWFKRPESAQMLMSQWMQYMRDHYHHMSYPVKYPMLGQMLTDAVQQIVDKDAPIEETLKAVADQWNSL